MPKRLNQLPVSLLDPVDIRANDGHIAEAFQRKGRLVRLAESLGYNRYWLMHSTPAADQGAAAAILLGHLAALSSSISIGTDMLVPTSANGSAYTLLDALYPGRMDGILTDPATGWEDVLQGAFTCWMFGTETAHAELVGSLGLPFAFAAHFAPAGLMDALEKYRSSFKPSPSYSAPYVLACVHAIVAESDDEAEFMASSLYQMVLEMRRKRTAPLLPPVHHLDLIASEQDWMAVRRMLWYSFFGDISSVRHALQTFVDQTDVDEIMICSAIFDERKEASSLRAIADLFGQLQPVNKSC